jgi:GntR family transcriptional regulator
VLFFKPNPASGAPIYRQLKQQVRHAVETGALRGGDLLPPIRLLAEQLVVNVNTVARVYRELEVEGLIELRQGVGAFIAEPGEAADETRFTEARQLARDLIAALQARGLTGDEIRRLLQVSTEEVLKEANSPPARLPASLARSFSRTE